MVVHVPSAEAVYVVLGSNATTTGSAAEHLGIREVVSAWTLRRSLPDEPLDALVFFERDDRLVIPLVELSVPEEVAGVEDVLEETVRHVDRKRVPTHALLLRCTVVPLIACDPLEFSNGICPRECETEKPLHEIEVLGITNDGVRRLVVLVSDRRADWEPATLDLGAHAALDVLAQRVDVVLRVPEDDRKHELPLRVVLEGEGGKPHALECAGVEQMNNPATID